MLSFIRDSIIFWYVKLARFLTTPKKKKRIWNHDNQTQVLDIHVAFGIMSIIMNLYTYPFCFWSIKKSNQQALILNPTTSFRWVFNYLGCNDDSFWCVYANRTWSPTSTDTVEPPLLSEKRFNSAVAVVFGDGVRLPAATSSSGGDTTELLNTPNMFSYLLKI